MSIKVNIAIASKPTQPGCFALVLNNTNSAEIVIEMIIALNVKCVDVAAELDIDKFISIAPNDQPKIVTICQLAHIIRTCRSFRRVWP